MGGISGWDCSAESYYVWRVYVEDPGEGSYTVIAKNAADAATIVEAQSLTDGGATHVERFGRLDAIAEDLALWAAKRAPRQGT